MSGEKEDTISKQKEEIDGLYGSLSESNRALSALNEKAAKLEAAKKELLMKLDASQAEISKLSESLQAQVKK